MARAEDARVAAANRARFGQPGAQRDAIRLEADRAARALDGNLISDDADGKG
jgi:hypothetical protein